MYFKKMMLWIGFILFFMWYPAVGQLSGGGEANPNLHTNMQSLESWQEMRFGMFIHWGPVALRGTEISWSRGREVPIDDYDNLYKEFNPVLFDAAKWVQAAKQAGMKYLIITAKHHDGFSLWDTKYSDYNIMNTPYGKDVLKALAEECKKQGIEFGIYYSIADWHHPDYPVDHRTLKPSYKSASKVVKERAMGRYVKFMKNQLEELIDNYDPAVLWFDGEWESPWTHQMGMDLYAYLRGIKDDLLINNRVDKGRQGMAGMTISEEFAGDFATPEQQIGSYNTQSPWESCITIGQQWAWRPNDKLKSTKEVANLLLNTVGGDGNLLLNVGPMMDGRIEQRQIDTLKTLGHWVGEHADAIYGTRGGPYKPTERFVSTRKGKKIFLHLLEDPGSSLSLPLPDGLQIKNAQFVGTGDQVDIRQMEGKIEIILPSNLPDKWASVIELELNQPAKTIDTIKRLRY